MNDEGWVAVTASGMPTGLKDDQLIQYRLDGELGVYGPEKAAQLAWGLPMGEGRITSFRLLAPVAAPAINPKDAIGSHKLPLHLWPSEATALGCLGLLEGREKYGRDNYVAGEGVIASIYVDACKRHLDAWFSGEECAPDSKLPHMAHALACLAIIVKAQAHGKLVDDRSYDPTGAYRRLVDEVTPLVREVQQAHADKSPKHYTIADVRKPA